MPTTLTDVRDRVRKDLHDTDSATYRWTDAQLDRHIDHAMSELSAAMPQEKSATIATAAGSRDLSLALLSDLIEVEQVEYPIGQFPPSLAGYSTWAATLTLNVDETPTGASLKLYYTARHALDGAGSTLSAFQADVLATGASAYAALEQSAFTVDRVTTGDAVANAYAAYGRARLSAFHQLLYQYGRRNRVRSRRAYLPA
jgi:hypothetical protein